MGERSWGGGDLPIAAGAGHRPERRVRLIDLAPVPIGCDVDAPDPTADLPGGGVGQIADQPVTST